MKKKYIIFIVLIIFIAFVCISLLVNKTFFKNYYINDKVQVHVPKYSYFIQESKKNAVYPSECCSSNIELNTLRSKSYLQQFINNYIENLPSCYDESYFYDAKYNVTYSKYIFESRRFYNKITIAFQKGNYCENEYVLEKQWIDIIRDSNITDYTFNYEQLLELLEKSDRIDFNDRIKFDDKNTYQASYVYNNLGYNLYFSVYKLTVIGVTRIDSNDAAKYAIYDIGKDAEVYLNSLYK